MSAPLIWLILGLLILGAEMLLGTIYLLALFIGALGGVLAALFDFSLTTQCTLSGILTILGVIIAYYSRSHIKKLHGKKSDLNNLDEGQLVCVNKVLENGTAQVSYRGTIWIAYCQNQKLSEGVWFIDRIDGTRLILSHKQE